MRTLMCWFYGRLGPVLRPLGGVGVFVGLLLVPVTLVGGYVAGRANRSIGAAATPRSSLPDGARMLKAGPWGEIEMIPITIAAPPERLPVRAAENAPTRWTFPGYTRDTLVKFLDTLDLSADARPRWLGADVLHELPDGAVELTPTHDLSLGLSGDARTRLTAELARTTDNMGQLWFFHATLLPDYLRQARLCHDTAVAFDRYGATYGDYRVVVDLPALLSAIPTYDERARLVRALTSQRTLLMRLHVHPTTDVGALVSYWGKALWATDAEALLGSLRQVKGGAWVDAVELLPPPAAGLLYTYPTPDVPLNGPPVRRDCHWTSFNFLRNTPDPDCGKPGHFAELLRTQYYPITAEDPRYGDVILFTRPDGVAVHSAVYVADDVVFTKNGETPIHPWMFSTLNDVEKQYACWVHPGERLTLTYYRAR